MQVWARCDGLIVCGGGIAALLGIWVNCADQIPNACIIAGETIAGGSDPKTIERLVPVLVCRAILLGM